jgi:hypothetical protein
LIGDLVIGKAKAKFFSESEESGDQEKAKSLPRIALIHANEGESPPPLSP